MSNDDDVLTDVLTDVLPASPFKKKAGRVKLGENEREEEGRRSRR